MGVRGCSSALHYFLSSPPGAGGFKVPLASLGLTQTAPLRAAKAEPAGAEPGAGDRGVGPGLAAPGGSEQLQDERWGCKARPGQGWEADGQSHPFSLAF